MGKKKRKNQIARRNGMMSRGSGFTFGGFAMKVGAFGLGAAAGGYADAMKGDGTATPFGVAAALAGVFFKMPLVADFGLGMLAAVPRKWGFDFAAKQQAAKAVAAGAADDEG